MKKLIFLFLILFMSILNIKADDTFYLGEKVPNMYVESIKGSDIHNGAPFLLHRSDGSVVYCINPFLMMSTTGTYKEYTYNDSIFNLTDEELNKLNIISYYGYGYQGHTDIKWFGITQYYMWKSLDFDDVYFTDVYYGTRVEKYVDEVSELENLVNDYYKLPSFAGNHYEYNPNTTYELIDTNNILSNYQIKESDIKASISGNKLTINTNGDGNYNITFVRKSPISRDYILYNLDGAQSLIYPGKINDITFNISIEVNSGSVTINKSDCENKKRLEATLEGSIFGIYKNNTLVSKLTINKDGSTNMNNLPLGNYTVKEMTSSKGYKKDSNVYDITISKTNKDIVINSCSEIIEGNLIINKYYGSDNDYKLDNSAVFEVYHGNKLIDTLNNQDKVKLEYGTYLVKQVSGKKYYDLISDFNVSIKEEKDYKYDFYTDKTDEIKAYEDLLNKREEALNQKEQELTDLENKIESEKEDLTNLKNEIESKEDELDNKKEELDKLEEELNKKEDDLNNLDSELEKEKEEVDKLKEEIAKETEELENKKEELKKQEEELEELKDELDSKKDNLDEKEESLKELEENINKKEEELNESKKQLESLEKELEEKEKTLTELENNINDKEIELNKTKEELDLLNKELSEKENNINQKEEQLTQKEKDLIDLENTINNREEDLNKRQQELIKLENKIEEEKDVLVVEVPNTGKKSYNKLISIILIFIGSIFVIYSKKKVTSR